MIREVARMQLVSHQGLWPAGLSCQLQGVILHLEHKLCSNLNASRWKAARGASLRPVDLALGMSCV